MTKLCVFLVVINETSVRCALCVRALVPRTLLDGCALVYVCVCMPRVLVWMFYVFSRNECCARCVPISIHFQFTYNINLADTHTLSHCALFHRVSYTRSLSVRFMCLCDRRKFVRRIFAVTAECTAEWASEKTVRKQWQQQSAEPVAL